MIERIVIQNFKSFGWEAATLELQPLNFLVGANATGKSNLLGALKFVRTALLHDVETAVRDAGFEETWHSCGGADSRLLRIELSARLPVTRVNSTASEDPARYEYGFSLRPIFRELSGPRVVVVEERMRVRFPASLEMTLVRDAHQFAVTEAVEGGERREITSRIDSRNAGRLVAGDAFLTMGSGGFREYVKHWRFFDIDPVAVRRPVALDPRRSPSLSERGEGVAAMVRNLELDSAGAALLGRVCESLRGVIPGFDRVSAEHLGDTGSGGMYALSFHEKAPPLKLGSWSSSDGTARLLAMALLAIGANDITTLLAIEEPERGVHPHLSRPIVELLRLASSRQQVIATTHNPEFLNELEPNEVMLFDKVNGRTVVRRASEVDQIEVFRKHFRLGELWAQGAMGGIP